MLLFVGFLTILIGKHFSQVYNNRSFKGSSFIKRALQTFKL
jgi:hypothetical protein